MQPVSLTEIYACSPFWSAGRSGSVAKSQSASQYKTCSEFMGPATNIYWLRPSNFIHLHLPSPLSSLPPPPRILFQRKVSCLMNGELDFVIGCIRVSPWFMTYASQQTGREISTVESINQSINPSRFTLFKVNNTSTISYLLAFFFFYFSTLRPK